MVHKRFKLETSSGIDKLIIDGQTPASPSFEDSFSYFDAYRHPLLRAYAKRDQRHSAEVARGLEYRAWNRGHMAHAGHHFGGCHHGKVVRGTLSFRMLDGSSSATPQFAYALGLPEHRLPRPETFAVVEKELRALEAKTEASPGYR